MTVTLDGTLGITSVAGSAATAVAGPAFSAYANAAQSVSSGVTTKVIFQAKDFDTANCFDNTTNYRFTPNVAGYYQINATVRLSGTAPIGYDVIIYKNGSPYRFLTAINGNLNTLVISGSITIQMNGTTDYLEVYADITATGPSFSANTAATSVFSGFLARSA